MTAFVLVPGAWLGGWAWREVTPRLRAAGHEVFPITLTGLGEREHLARPETDLETHITDVVSVIRWNDLSDVVLAGHSYAGAVVAGVADRVPERIRRLVFVDSAPLADGQALLDLYPPEARQALQQTVDTFGQGWRLPFPGVAMLAESASVAGVGEAARSLMTAKASPQPWATFTQPLRLQGSVEPSYERVLIACDDMRGLIAAGIPPIVAMTSPPWRSFELATGHWPMFSAPADVAKILIDLE